MRSFLIQAYATYKGLFFWLNWISYISSVILAPIIMVITYAILGRFALGPQEAIYYGFGIIMSRMNYILIGGITQTYTYDRDLGTLSFLYVSPANRLVNYLSRPLLHCPNALLVFITGLVTLWLMVGLDFSAMNWGAFILALLVTTVSMASFSQFISIFTIVVQDWTNTMSLTVGILFVFTGMIIPLDVFPPAVQEFAHFLPMTSGLAAMRSAFSGAPFSGVYTDILLEALVGLVYLAIGFVCFVLFERVAKRTGALMREAL
jgi:ABC-2 type transport system permease protein